MRTQVFGRWGPAILPTTRQSTLLGVGGFIRSRAEGRKSYFLSVAGTIYLIDRMIGRVPPIETTAKTGEMWGMDGDAYHDCPHRFGDLILHSLERGKVEMIASGHPAARPSPLRW